jgi:thiol-disulfide isomerase/thioredoxin
MSIKMKQLHLIIFCLLIASGIHAQARYSIQGKFPPLAHQQVKLLGFEGFDTYTIDAADVQEDGSFTLYYTDRDLGMGYLAAEDSKPFFIVLDNEGLQLEGELLSLPENVIIIRGTQNRLFGQYASEHPRREQALSAWEYLERIYSMDTSFSNQTAASQAIAAEKKRIRDVDRAFLEGLDPESYISWYLPARKLISSVSAVAQYSSGEIPANIEAFRKIDYADPKLYKSGLLKDAIEAHYWLIENMGEALDTVYAEMNVSTDFLIASLLKDEKKLNMVTDFLFDLLERRSLFTASEYLALKVLNETSCTIDADLAKQLETYRAMKKGNIAPDIRFTPDTYKQGALFREAEKLSDLTSDYYLIVFGAAWCKKCTEEIPLITRYYDTWKARGLEVVFVSLDEDRESFLAFARDFPFVSTSDFKRWEGKAVQDYYVFGTPLMFLLDKDRVILQRPASVNVVNAWVEWFLKD